MISASALRRRHKKKSRDAPLTTQPQPQQQQQAPAQPKTPYGQMLTYYLAMQPQLFTEAVDDQLRRLQAEKDNNAKSPTQQLLLPGTDDQQQPPPSPTPHPEMTEEEESAALANNNPKDDKSMALLRRRIDEQRAAESRATLEDLLYVSILERFVLLGVEMLPRLDGVVDARQANLIALTEGVHSKEALELVREHLLSATGGAGGAPVFSNALVKMSKFQMAQVYAASVMFGYFLRRVDKRFQLERSVGVLGAPALGRALTQGSLDSIDGNSPQAAAMAASNEEAVARLEALLARAADMEVADDPDSAPSSLEEDEAGEQQPRGRREQQQPPPPRDASPTARGPTLRAYIERFDPATMAQTARVVSVEGAAVVERQTTALFGDVKQLTRAMQEALQKDGPVTSAADLYSRIERVVSENAVETLAMTVGTQRRVVLEAVAFGAFLRDVEDRVQGQYVGLLTPMPPPPGGRGGGGMLGPGGGGGGGGGSDDDDDDDWRGGGGRGGGGGGNIKRGGGDTLTM
jgi:uncharacterized membrane protein YgcG